MKIKKILCYMFGLVVSIPMFIWHKDKEMKFHALQSSILSIIECLLLLIYASLVMRSFNIIISNSNLDYDTLAQYCANQVITVSIVNLVIVGIIAVIHIGIIIKIIRNKQINLGIITKLTSTLMKNYKDKLL